MTVRTLPIRDVFFLETVHEGIRWSASRSPGAAGRTSPCSGRPRGQPASLFHASPEAAAPSQTFGDAPWLPTDPL